MDGFFHVLICDQKVGVVPGLWSFAEELISADLLYLMCA